MPGTEHGDISMRHFPDLSDASFQIPPYQDDEILTMNRPRELELDFDAFDDDEIDGLDMDPFATPLPPRTMKHAPLTLSELTPRGEREPTGIVEQELRPAQREEVTERQSQKEPNSVRHVLPKKVSVDDMFERRKRDNYQQMGIDLTSKSSARLRHDKTRPAEPEHTHGRPTKAQTGPTVVKKVAGKRHESGNQANNVRNAKSKRPVLAKDAGIMKHKSRLPSSSAAQPKSILKPSKPTSTLPPSTLLRTLTAASKTPQADRPRWGDVVAEVEHTSGRRDSGGSGIGALGGGLIDVLVMYGEKLKGSLGFPSSSSKASTPQSSDSNESHRHSSHDVSRGPRSATDGLIHDTQNNIAGPSSRPLTLSDLAPSTSHGRQRDALTLSDLSPSKRFEDNGPDLDEQYPAKMSPTRSSGKRISAQSPRQESKKRKLVEDKPSQAPSSLSQAISDHDTTTHSSSAVKAVAKPKPLGPSRAVNRRDKPTTQMRPRSQPIKTTDNTTSRRHIATVRDLKERSHVKAATTGHEEQCPPYSLPVQPGPAFASDISHHRALGKTQTRKEEKGKGKSCLKATGTKPCFSKPAPPARPTVRRTVPAGFTFQSEARATQRNAEFEEKRKTWESRALPQALPMPDFAIIHAAQAEMVRSRRVVPVLPTDAPALTTMVRAKEREKFEEERRGRERAVEILREQRERERAEQEEREYREARKRTVPRAHEVPDWYKDIPKRKEVE